MIHSNYFIINNMSLIMSSKHCFVVAVCIIIIATSDGVLFKKGWYIMENKGPKITINNINNIDDSHFSSAIYLKIQAKIPVLLDQSVRNLPSLEVLKLVECGIHNINPGAFTNIPNITTIALNDNRIKGIKTGVFNNLKLSTLYLHRNKIKFIETEAFDNITSLTKLHLNSNFLIYWDNNWFKNTPQLSELYIRRNALRSLPSKSFKNLKNNRIKIYLSKNFISSIATDAFSGLIECSQIWLDRNDIVELEENLFLDLQYLEVLFLSKNHLTSIPHNLLGHLNSDLITLDLTHNNNLTCLDYNLIKKVKITNLQKINHLNCDCIKKLKKELVNNGLNNEINSDC